MRKQTPLIALAFCLLLFFFNPVLTLAQSSSPYYISFEVVLRVPQSGDLTAVEKKVLNWRVALLSDNKPVTAKTQNPTSPGSTTTPAGYKDLALYRLLTRIEPGQRGGQLTLLDADDAMLASQQLDWTFPAGDYQFTGVFTLKGETAEMDKSSVQLRAGLPEWATSIKPQLAAVATPTVSPTSKLTPGGENQTAVTRRGGNPFLLIILSVVFLGLAGVIGLHGFQIGLFGTRKKIPVQPNPEPAPSSQITVEGKKEKKEKKERVKPGKKPSPLELPPAPMPDLSGLADGGGEEPLPLPQTPFMPEPPFAGDGGAEFMPQPPSFAPVSDPFASSSEGLPPVLSETPGDDELSDSIGRVGGAVTETIGTALATSTETTPVRHIWQPPIQDGKTTFVGKRKHLDSQFERKSLDFMLTAPASKWLHADCVEIDNQVFLSDLAEGLWTKVSGMGFGPAESAFMQNEARLDFLLEVFKEGQPKKLIAVECDGSQHFTDPVQQQRDVKKNRILDKLGIPLVRVTQVHQLEERLKALVSVLWEGQNAPLHPHSVLKLPGSMSRKVTRFQRNRKRRRKAA